MYFSSLLNLPPTHYSKLFHLITLTILTEQCQLQDSSLCVSIFMLFLSLRFIYSPQHLILRHHQSTFFHYGERPISHPHKITVTKCRLLALKWRRSVCFDEGLHIYIYIMMKRRPFLSADRFYSVVEKRVEKRKSDGRG